MNCEWCNWFKHDFGRFRESPINGPICDCGYKLIFHLQKHPHEAHEYRSSFSKQFEVVCAGFKSVIIEQVIL